MGVLVFAVFVRAEGDFTRTLTPTERMASGLDKLTPSELEQLKAVVERYKSGEVAVVRQQAEQKMAATEEKAKSAEQKAAVAEAKVRQAEPAASVVSGTGQKTPGWLAALKTKQKADDMEELNSRLVGEMSRLKGKRRFTLENGQKWEMIEEGYYDGPPLENPQVWITPGAFGTFWLQVDGVGVRFRVKPIKLE